MSRITYRVVVSDGRQQEYEREYANKADAVADVRRINGWSRVFLSPPYTTGSGGCDTGWSAYSDAKLAVHDPANGAHAPMIVLVGE